MNDREHWLQLTVEEALEPGWPVCDPHHHLWDMPGSRYLLEEFLSDLSGGHRVTSTVYVECLQKYRDTGPGALRPVGETEFVERLAENQPESGTRVAEGIVGFADLTLGAEVEDVLVGHVQASERFRGIRHATAWHASDRIHNAHTKPPKSLLMDPVFREGFARLQRAGLSFDAWLYHSQLLELTDLARQFPETTIVLNHMAGPLGIGPYADRHKEVFDQWRRIMTSLVDCENVYVKLGGRAMTMSGFGWHKRETPPGSAELASAMAPYVNTCVELFGTRRCMFESNFPVDRASCPYTVLWNAFKRLCAEVTESERSDLLHGTASRVYRLEA